MPNNIYLDRDHLHTRWANTHLKYLHEVKEGNNECQESQPYLAASNALEAAVNTASEWCPEIHDVEMLLELAKQADPEGRYTTTPAS